MSVPATTQPAHDTRPADPAGPRHEPAAAPPPTGGRAAPAVASRLLELLRCPLTGGALIPVDGDHLMSDRPYRDGVHPVYPVSHGIPCLNPVA